MNTTRRRTPWIVLAVAVVLAGLFVVLAVASPDTGEQTGAQRVRRLAPRAAASTIDGRPFTFDGFRGRWVVVNFFNSTCVPCKAEHPELIRFAADHAGRDRTQLVTVINDDSDDNVRRWFAANGGGSGGSGGAGGTWPVVRDPDGVFGVGFGVTGVPETYLIDPTGLVRLRWVGETTSAALDEWLTKLAAEPSS